MRSGDCPRTRERLHAPAPLQPHLVSSSKNLDPGHETCSVGSTKLLVAPEGNVINAPPVPAVANPQTPPSHPEESHLISPWPISPDSHQLEGQSPGRSQPTPSQLQLQRDTCLCLSRYKGKAKPTVFPVFQAVLPRSLPSWKDERALNHPAALRGAPIAQEALAYSCIHLISAGLLPWGKIHPRHRQGTQRLWKRPLLNACQHQPRTHEPDSPNQKGS